MFRNEIDTFTGSLYYLMLRREISSLSLYFYRRIKKTTIKEYNYCYLLVTLINKK